MRKLDEIVGGFSLESYDETDELTRKKDQTCIV